MSQLHRAFTYGEPIDAVEVHQDDAFDIVFTVKDDNGADWSDDWTATASMYMSNVDNYSGSAYFYSGSGTTSGGSVTINFTTTATANFGDYMTDFIMSSGSVELTSTFNLTVLED